MTELTLSARELDSCHLTKEHLEVAVKAVEEDGFVVLCNVIDPAHLQLLQQRMIADVEEILALDDVPWQFRDGHLQQDAPPFPPYLFRDVLVNDLVVEITHAILGDGLHNSSYSGNCCVPNDNPQPLHVDIGQLFPGQKEATPAFAIVVNVPVVEMTPENGSTELWPGTHRDTSLKIDEDIKVPEEAQAKWRGRSEPVQPTVPLGGVIIRDMRTWHRGMPNRSERPRPMIAMVHCISWWRHKRVLQFPKGTEEIFENSPLTTLMEFVDGPIEYLNRHRKYDYQGKLG